jgi:hypothetical protein
MRAVPLLVEDDLKYLGVQHVSHRKCLLQAARTLKNVVSHPVGREYEDEKQECAAQIIVDETCVRTGTSRTRKVTVSGQCTDKDALVSQGRGLRDFCQESKPEELVIGSSTVKMFHNSAGLFANIGEIRCSSPQSKHHNRAACQMHVDNAKRQWKAHSGCMTVADAATVGSSSITGVIVPDSDADSDFDDRRPAARTQVTIHRKKPCSAYPHSNAGVLEAAPAFNDREVERCAPDVATICCSGPGGSAAAAAQSAPDASHSDCAALSIQDGSLSHEAPAGALAQHRGQQQGMATSPSQKTDGSQFWPLRASGHAKGPLKQAKAVHSTHGGRSRNGSYIRRVEQRLLDALFPKGDCNGSWSSDSDEEGTCAQGGSRRAVPELNSMKSSQSSLSAGTSFKSIISRADATCFEEQLCLPTVVERDITFDS